MGSSPDNSFNEQNDEIDNYNAISTKSSGPLKLNQENKQKDEFNNINIINSYSENEEKKKSKTFLGRKKKDDDRPAQHTKLSIDNKIRKIKTYFMNFIHDKLNESLLNKYEEFRDINSEIKKNLNKEDNLALMEMTFKEIYLANSLSKRYNKYNQEQNNNKKLIKEIYEKKEETEVIKILDSKFIDLFKLFRINDIDKFYSDSLQKEKKKFKTIEEAENYVNELKELLFKYEKWFEPKYGKKGSNK